MVRGVSVMLALGVVACAGQSKHEIAGQQIPLSATTDFGDAVATSVMAEGADTIVTTLEDPEQTEALLVLEWNVAEGSVVFYRGDDREPTVLSRDDVRLAQTPTLAQANQLAYEQWTLGDEAYWCYCMGHTPICFGINVCRLEDACNLVITSYDDGTTEEKWECTSVFNCTWEVECYYECIDWDCVA